MLADRHYMRESSGRMPQPFSVKLMIVLVAVFVFQCINDVYLKNPNLEFMLALTPESLTKGYIWQFLTFQFLHGGLWHLLGNLIGIWFFCRDVESWMGTRRFILAYFGFGVIGGILQAILMVMFPTHYGGWVVGASAGIMGIFTIFALLESEQEIRLNFILPIKAKTLLWITLGISAFFTLVPSLRSGSAAHAAHLGGMLAAFAFVKMKWHQDFRPLPWEEAMAGLREKFRAKPSGQKIVKAPIKYRPSPEAAGVAEPEDEDFMSKDVDPILDKIHAHGIESLTDKERKILEKARSKMAKR